MFSFERNKQQIKTVPRNRNKLGGFFSSLYQKSGQPPAEVNPVIVQHLKNSDRVVYGSIAMNQQLPNYLRRPAGDWDVKAHNARQFAYRIEDALEELQVEDMFTVEKLPVSGEDFNVFRVVYKPTGKVVVDASVPENGEMPPHKIIDGIRYKALEAIYKSKLEDVKNPEKRYRRSKDLRDVRRIEAALRSTPNRFPEKFIGESRR